MRDLAPFVPRRDIHAWLHGVRVVVAIVDCVDPAGALVVLKHAMRCVPGSRGVFFSDQALLCGEEILWVEVDRIDSLAAYSEFMLLRLPQYALCSGGHWLIIQTDGYPLARDRWREVFLEYDYVGAPWPGGTVGNGGFSLRGPRLFRALTSIAERISRVHPEDVVICHDLRPALEDRGVRFAPRDRAAEFSDELGEGSAPFGFHGRHASAVHGASLESLPVDVYDLHNRAVLRRSDISAHLSILASAASQVSTACEVTLCGGESTAALLASGARRVTTYDVAARPWVMQYERAAARSHVQFDFRINHIGFPSIPDVGFLLLDSWHTRVALASQLRAAEDRVEKFIAIHDTGTFGVQGQYPGTEGVWPAVIDFIQRAKHWRLAYVSDSCNGLVVLARESEDGLRSVGPSGKGKERRTPAPTRWPL